MSDFSWQFMQSSNELDLKYDGGDGFNNAVVFSGIGTNALFIWSPSVFMSLVGPSNLVDGTWATNAALAKANTAMTTATNHTRSYAQPIMVGTNLATAADQTVSLNQDSTVCVTNVVAGAVNVWFTNAVDRKWFVLRVLADGSARTLSFTNASGLTLNVIATNGFSVLTLPQFPVAAGKIGTVVGRVWTIAGVTNVDLFGNVQP
jgi:hypothetical protein